MTITEITQPDQLELSIGDVVWFIEPDEADRLALVACVAHQTEPPGACRCGCASGLANDQVTVMVANPANGITGTLETITKWLRKPQEPLTPQQQEIVQKLTNDLLSRCIREREQAGRLAEQAYQRADAAEATITSMRAYAIEKHQDGTICREGLNDFLQAHDLPMYTPRYQAHVTLTLSVTVNCDDDEDKDDIRRIVESNLAVDTDDSDRVCVDDWFVGYDGVGGVEEITD